MAHRILVAEDDELMRNYLGRVFNWKAWDVVKVADGDQALAQLESKSFDVAVHDDNMPGHTGLQLLDEVKRQGMQTDVVLLTGQGSIEMAVSAIQNGARDFLTKPLEPKEARAKVGDLLDRRRPTPHVLAWRLDEYVRSHAHQTGLVLQDLCDRFHISQRYACLLFQMELNTTFRKSLNRYRIERACELLAEGDLPMYHIADACGFRNQRRFAVVFRREKQASPTRYRMMLRRDSRA